MDGIRCIWTRDSEGHNNDFGVMLTVVGKGCMNHSDKETALMGFVLYLINVSLDNSGWAVLQLWAGLKAFRVELWARI